MLICWLDVVTIGCKSVAQKTYTQRLIPIDFNDSNYTELSFYAIDTITQEGWSIKYFIKDDSTKYDDIYNEWSKGNVSGIYKAESVLQFRRYFIPQYSGEEMGRLHM